MMKFNWGTGILITIILFLVAVVAFFIWSSNLDINLVEDNYYEKELAYQEMIDKITNTESLGEKVKVTLAGGMLRINFPKYFIGKKTDGNVLFYRPSDPGKDFTIPLAINDSSFQMIDASRLDPGRYLIKIDWVTDSVEYYFEEAVLNE
jgi:hypothetical protein